MQDVTIEYRPAQVGDFRVHTQQSAEGEREVPVNIEVNGELHAPTQRFWRSLFHRFGLSPHVFRYFSYPEVITRVVQRNRNTRLRLCIERNARGSSLLACSSPTRPLLGFDDAQAMIRRHDGMNLDYYDGTLSSLHEPRSGRAGTPIGPDVFHNRFLVEVPIDGFGDPRIFLSLVRQVCSNGAVGYSRAFRSDIRIGDDVKHTLERALGQFDHDEGYSALRQRFDAAQKSWASLGEMLLLRKTLWKLAAAGDIRTPGVVAKLDAIAGDLHALYGLANLESLTAKRQRVLPAQCRVYDLLNYASEVATHHATPASRMRLQAYVGSLVCDEYDLEGTAEKVPEFRDLFASLN